VWVTCLPEASSGGFLKVDCGRTTFSVPKLGVSLHSAHWVLGDSFLLSGYSEDLALLGRAWSSSFAKN
jgi:hypothetical protein